MRGKNGSKSGKTLRAGTYPGKLVKRIGKEREVASEAAWRGGDWPHCVLKEETPPTGGKQSPCPIDTKGGLGRAQEWAAKKKKKRGTTLHRPVRHQLSKGDWGRKLTSRL